MIMEAESHKIHRVSQQDGGSGEPRQWCSSSLKSGSLGPRMFHFESEGKKKPMPTMKTVRQKGFSLNIYFAVHLCALSCQLGDKQLEGRDTESHLLVYHPWVLHADLMCTGYIYTLYKTINILELERAFEVILV